MLPSFEGDLAIIFCFFKCCICDSSSSSSSISRRFKTLVYYILSQSLNPFMNNNERGKDINL